VKFLFKTAFYTVVGLVLLFGLKTIYTKWQDRTLDVGQHVAWVRDMAADGAEDAKKFVADRARLPSGEPTCPEVPNHDLTPEDTVWDSVGSDPSAFEHDRIGQDQARYVHSRVADNISCLMKAQSTLMRGSEVGNE